MTALILASINGHAAIVKLLIEAGANKNAKDEVSYYCKEYTEICVCLPLCYLNLPLNEFLPPSER
jgi:hypothetical protein